MKNYILFGLLIVYTLSTIRFAIKFNATDAYFNKRQKLIHNILIWAIPFIWIIIIKTLIKPIPGSADYNKTKQKGTFSERGMGIWSEGHESGSGHQGDHHVE